MEIPFRNFTASRTNEQNSNSTTLVVPLRVTCILLFGQRWVAKRTPVTAVRLNNETKSGTHRSPTDRTDLARAVIHQYPRAVQCQVIPQGSSQGCWLISGILLVKHLKLTYQVLGKRISTRIRTYGPSFAGKNGWQQLTCIYDLLATHSSTQGTTAAARTTTTRSSWLTDA